MLKRGHSRQTCWILLLAMSVAMIAPDLAGAKKRRKPPRKHAAPGKDEVTLQNERSVADELALARKTLAYVEKSVRLPELAAQLKSLGSSPDIQKLRRLRRRILFSHPALAFDRLLINQNAPTLYSHNCDQYLGRHSRPGLGPLILENWKSADPTITQVFKGKLPKGAYCKPKLSWDAKKMVFAFCDHSAPKNERRFFIWEGKVDGSSLRQLTGNANDPFERWGNRYTSLIEDGDPCYLSDGGIAFVSSRCQGFGRCHNGRYTPSFLMYRCDQGGRNIRMLSWGEANEADPVVVPDGRIVYTRWEYINRPVTKLHMLWSMKPDGTTPSNFYGNNTCGPWMVSESVPIAGSKKVVALATGHHSFSTGTVIVIDPEKGEDGPTPVTRITPKIGYFEDEKITTPGCYSTPWPLTEDLFLVAYSPSQISKQGRTPADNYAIYLIDSFGGRELIYRHPKGSCFSPTPVMPRKKPPVLPSALPKTAPNTGVLVIQNIYETRVDPKGVIKKGMIKAIRINEILNQPAANKNQSQPSLVRHESAKRILGTVPVLADGSVAFELPARIPIQLQSLDKNGVALLTMRTFISLQPGEKRSCVGCHEPRGSAPIPTPKLAMRQALAKITPSPGSSDYKGGFSYPKTVQPVLDRHCIRCHGLKQKKGNLDLTGALEKSKSPKGYGKSMLGLVPRSYNQLMNRKDLIVTAKLHKETIISRPGDYFAASCKLTRILLNGQKGHETLTLDDAGRRRIFDWLDLNAQCYGDYSWNRIEQRQPEPAGERALRTAIRKQFGDEIAKQPFYTLVNPGLPERSRILLAPLAANAGGWGQIDNGWSSTQDPRYQQMKKLVLAAIKPLEFRDKSGTCQRKRCACGSCWVKKSEDAFQSKVKKIADGRCRR